MLLKRIARVLKLGLSNNPFAHAGIRAMFHRFVKYRGSLALSQTCEMMKFLSNLGSSDRVNPVSWLMSCLTFWAEAQTAVTDGVSHELAVKRQSLVGNLMPKWEQIP